MGNDLERSKQNKMILYTMADGKRYSTFDEVFVKYLKGREES